MNEDLFDDIDGVSEVKVTGFKKKLVKGKKSARPKLSFDIPTEEPAQESRQEPTQEPTQELGLDLEDDPEYNPVIENIDQIQSLDTFNIPQLRNDAHVDLQNKKYVPIASNSEPEVKVSRRELQHEYEDGYNYDDGANERKKEVEEDDGDLDLGNDDDLAQGPAKLDFSASTKAQNINQDVYDLELDSDYSHQSDEGTASSARYVAVQPIPALSDQIASLKVLVQELSAKREDYEHQHKQYREQLEKLRDHKNSILAQIQ